MLTFSIPHFLNISPRHPLPVLLTELTLVSFVVFLAGCATSQAGLELRSNGSTSEAAEIESRLRGEVERWRGTPHLTGGTNSDGMDCSAFVQQVFKEAFELDLPRTTEHQVRQGRRISSRELSAGDLVFFRPPTKTRHVGIYLSDGKFAHVSSSQGVTVSELDLPYWKDAYWTSRRILPEMRPPVRGEIRASVAEKDPDDVRTGSGSRVGW